MRVPARRRARLCALLVAMTAAFALVGVSAPPAEASAARAALSWADDVARTVLRARELTRTPTLGSAAARSDEIARALDDLAARAPAAAERNAAITARFDELVAAQARTRALQEAVLAADDVRDGIPADARAVAGSATPDRNLQDELTTASDEILRDAACDVAADVLLPPEKQDIEESGWIEVVPDVLKPVAGPLGGAAINYATVRLARVFGPGAAASVAWFNYGKGIEEKSGRYAAGLREQVDTPDGLRTRAYIQYVRTCLATPR
jgi:hypothetical protein